MDALPGRNDLATKRGKLKGRVEPDVRLQVFDGADDLIYFLERGLRIEKDGLPGGQFHAVGRKPGVGGETQPGVKSGVEIYVAPVEEMTYLVEIALRLGFRQVSGQKPAVDSLGIAPFR